MAEQNLEPIEFENDPPVAQRDLVRFMEIQSKNLERKRAMLLSWVDEIERMQGYGEPGSNKGPRTAQIRKDYRDRGEPPISS